MRVAFATDRTQGLAPDDALVVEPARRLGIAIEPAIWDSPETDWDRYALVVLRSTWDYHHRAREFLDWVARLERRGTRLSNPPAVVRANVDKRYLLDLERAGAPIVPTRLLDRADDLEPGSRGWSRIVVKPSVSAGAFLTFRVEARDAGPAIARVLSAAPALVQPYSDAIEREGEWSFVYLSGTLSHVVLKRPAAGDFRVQEDFGGRFEATTASAADRAVAERVMDVARARELLYARVDLVRLDGALRLMELELTEPSLYLGLGDGAPARFAAAIARALS